MSQEEERQLALTYLRNLCLCPQSDPADIETLFSYFEREHYHENEIVWKQGSKSKCAKLLVRGQLVSIVDGTDITESIKRGNMLGELGLVTAGTNRLSTVVCVTETAILYTLSKESWETLLKTNPGVARLIDEITIRYLAHRCQHVSNRIFETRCLPI
jgi:CRP-like cAMP-binding protein